MAFLAPVFLAGLSALVLPVLLHLRKNKPKEIIAFSSLMFLEESPLQTKTRSRLQDILLLILRCLALSLLILAFARPFFPAKHETVVSDDGATMHYILVDTSASMRGEALEQARKTAKTIIEDTPINDWIALASFSDQIRPLLNPARAQEIAVGSRKSSALSLLSTIEGDWKSTHLDTALIAAISSFRPENQLKIHLVSDLQTGSSLDKLRDEIWPQALQVILHPVTPKENWSNAGVQILPAQNQELRARVRNSQGSENSDFTLQWGSQSEAIQIHLPPGESTIFEAPEGLAKEGTIRLSGDDYAYDNEAAWITPILPVAHIWHPAQTQAHDTREGSYFLNRALQSTPDYNIEITAEKPSQTPALTVINAESDVADLLQAGGTALFPLRDQSSADFLGKLVGVSASTTKEATVTDHVLFGEIDFQSEVFSPFADARYSDFSRIRVWKYRRLPDELLAQGRVLASFDSGDAAWISFPIGKGILHVLTTTWRPVDSQLALSSKFPPLLHGLLSQSLQTDNQTGPVHPSETYDSPGIQRTDEATFVVQLDPSETERTPLPESELRALGLPLDRPKDLQQAAAIATQLSHAEQESRQRIAWWLLVAAAAFFLVETLVAGVIGAKRTLATP
ncbi:MAG: BatA domain-containing protein [Verrucomicrobiota bacterium]